MDNHPPPLPSELGDLCCWGDGGWLAPQAPEAPPTPTTGVSSRGRFGVLSRKVLDLGLAVDGQLPLVCGHPRVVGCQPSAVDGRLVAVTSGLLVIKWQFSWAPLLCTEFFPGPLGPLKGRSTDCLCQMEWDSDLFGAFRGSIRTARAPRQVFEQLFQEMVYRERSCRWCLVGSEALPFPLIGCG